MIIYFTGTGNSRYLADILATQLGDSALDASRLIRSGEHPDFESDKPYVFVSPVYAWRLPRLFEKWLRTCSFAGNKQAYFILNCGSEIGAAGNYIEKLCKQTKLVFMGTAEVVMPDNYIVMFDASAKEEAEGIIDKAREQMLRIAEQIETQAKFDRVKSTLLGHIYSSIVNPCFYTFYIRTSKFYATDACINCGKCTNACMLNNISLKNGKPVWGKDCTHCMACISGCPVEAIEYGRNTKGRRRYVCPR